jgi:ABC-2 type transport system permease protein
MKLLNDAWTMACKDLRMFLRDRAALCVTFLVPIALVTVFGWIMTYAFGGGSGVPKITLWFVDEDLSERSQQVLRSLGRSEMIKLLPGKDGPRLSADELRTKIADGDAHHGIIIPKGFGTRDEEGKLIDMRMVRDPGRTLEDRMIQIAILQSSFTSGPQGWTDAMRRMLEKQGLSEKQIESIEGSMSVVQQDFQDAFQSTDNKDAARITDGSPATESSGTSDDSGGDALKWIGNAMALETEDIEPPSRPKRVTYQQAQSVSGMSVMMLLFGLTGAGALLLSEKESGTLRRLFAMPIARESVLLGKLLFIGILGTLQMLILFVYGELMFGVGLFRDPLTLAVLIVTWVAASSGFAMFIATFCKSAKQADGLATVLILVMAALGGCWFPLQMMDLPTPMFLITRSMMTFWAMDGFQGMLWNQLSVFDFKIQKAIAIQWVWGLSLLAIAIYFFRRNYIPK